MILFLIVLQVDNCMEWMTTATCQSCCKKHDFCTPWPDYTFWTRWPDRTSKCPWTNFIRGGAELRTYYSDISDEFRVDCAALCHWNVISGHGVFCNCLWYKVFLLFTIYKQSQKQNRKNLQKKLRNMKVVEENNRKIALNWLWNLKVRVSKWENILGKQLFVCVYRKTSQWFIYRLNIKIMYIRIQQSVKDFRCILRSMKTK